MGTGQAMTVAQSLHREGWSVSAITLRGPVIKAGFDVRTVNLAPLEMVVPYSPLRFREDWLLNTGYETFDRLAQRLVEPTDVFYGLNGSCLHSLRKARRLGSMTVLCACNTFLPKMQLLVCLEYEALGVKHPAINSAAVRRVLDEYREADLIRAESTMVASSLVEGGIPAEKIFLLPPSLDLGEYTKAPHAPSDFHTVFVGQFSIRKGLHHLMRAWEQLPQDRGRLILHGGGGGWAKRLLAPYRHRADVVLRAGRPHRTYREASVCVVPSIEDGFCRVALEAMASGVPVIVTDKVGAKDLVHDGREGFIVPAGDANEIAERIHHLQLHPFVRERMAGAAFERAQQYSFEAEGRRLSAVLHGALAGRRSQT
jgi:glycosyltransferase involved in cell wall biosynthesis